MEWGAYLHGPRNLTYIFDPEACVSSVAKTTAQRLDQWKAVLGQLLLLLLLHIKSHPDLSAQYPLLSVPINTTSRYSQFPWSQENLHYKIK